ncbi:MAG TPA: hypothetical protein PL041_14405 [Melioribacteraceae bacterium]|nr:hypothetical protein [Melioribacteraceae bacterium]
MRTAYVTTLTEYGQTYINILKDGKKYYYKLKTENTLLILLYMVFAVLLIGLKK